MTTRKVLIAEDEESFRIVFPQFLTSQGFEVQTTADGRSAISLGESFVPDILIVDWMLDDLSGIDVALALREANPQLGVIFITGFSKDELCARAADRNLERFECLEKPFRVAKILEAIEAVSGGNGRAGGAGEAE